VAKTAVIALNLGAGYVPQYPHYSRRRRGTKNPTVKYNIAKKYLLRHNKT